MGRKKGKTSLIIEATTLINALIKTSQSTRCLGLVRRLLDSLKSASPALHLTCHFSGRVYVDIIPMYHEYVEVHKVKPIYFLVAGRLSTNTRPAVLHSLSCVD